MVRELIICGNKPAHGLKFAECKIFVGQGALDGGAVHGSVDFIFIEGVIISGREAGWLVGVRFGEVQCVVGLMGLVGWGGELIVSEGSVPVLGRIGLEKVLLVGIHEK